jgi:hypothetical protein
MFEPDNEHIHHRLLHRGFQHSWVVCTIALLHAIACTAAILVPYLSLTWALLCLAYLATMGLWYLHQLDFFARFVQGYHLRRERRTRQRMKNRELIGVVQADPVLQHALSCYHQEHFTFQFVSARQLPADSGMVRNWSAALIENHYDNRLADDIDLALKVSRTVECPVFVLSSSAGWRGWETAMGRDSTITFVNKPVYVPVVLKKIAETIEQVRENPPVEEPAHAVQERRKRPRAIVRGSA